MTLKEMMAELPKLTKAEKRELRRAIDRELGDAEERVQKPERLREHNGRGTNF
jgi:hypothetical protein